MTVSAQHRVDHDRREKAERSESDRHQVRERTLESDFRQLIGSQRAKVPDETEHGGQEQERIEGRACAWRPAGPDDHHEQHGVQDHARAQPDEIQQLANIQWCGQRMPRSCRSK